MENEDDGVDFEGTEMFEVGALIIKCAKCAAEIKVPIKAGLSPKENNRVYIRTSADIVDYSAHALYHRSERGAL